MSRKSYRPIPQCLLGVTVLLVCAAGARAAQPPVDLGTASSFAVLGGSTVTNTGPTVANGDLGVSPGGSITGFPPGIVNGAVHAVDAVADQAQADLTAGYDSAAGRGPAAPLPGDLGGLFMTAGVYNRPAALQLTGNAVFDAQGDPDAVFIVQVGTALTTASNSRVVLLGGAQACNIFWQIGSSATLGTRTAFMGVILSRQSITLDTGASVEGRVLARGAAVTLDTNTVNRGMCTPAADPGDPGGGQGGPGGGGDPGGGGGDPGGDTGAPGGGGTGAPGGGGTGAPGGGTGAPGGGGTGAPGGGGTGRRVAAARGPRRRRDRSAWHGRGRLARTRRPRLDRRGAADHEPDRGCEDRRAHGYEQVRRPHVPRDRPRRPHPQRHVPRRRR